MSDNNNGGAAQARMQRDPAMSSGPASGQLRMGAFYLRLVVLSLLAASTFGHQDNRETQHVSISPVISQHRHFSRGQREMSFSFLLIARLP